MTLSAEEFGGEEDEDIAATGVDSSEKSILLLQSLKI